MMFYDSPTPLFKHLNPQPAHPKSNLKLPLLHNQQHQILFMRFACTFTRQATRFSGPAQCSATSTIMPCTTIFTQHVTCSLCRISRNQFTLRTWQPKSSTIEPSSSLAFVHSVAA